MIHCFVQMVVANRTMVLTAKIISTNIKIILVALIHNFIVQFAESNSGKNGLVTDHLAIVPQQNIP